MSINFGNVGDFNKILKSDYFINQINNNKYEKSEMYKTLFNKIIHPPTLYNNPQPIKLLTGPATIEPQAEERALRSKDLAQLNILLSDTIPLCFQASDAPGMKKALGELAALLKKRKTDTDFICEGFNRIQDFLKKAFFLTGELFFAGDDKRKVYMLGPLFEIADQHLSVYRLAATTKQYQTIKLQLANLPKPKPSSEYPNLKLTEKEKLSILRREISSRANQEVETFVAQIGKTQLAPKEHFYLAKLISNSSELSPLNREHLRIAVEKLLPTKVKNWDDVRLLQGLLMMRFANSVSSEGLVSKLYRLSKVCAFFERQKDFSEEAVFIPAWYHATKKESVVQILDDGEIEVRQGVYRGCFVSTQREDNYGKYAFAMSQRVVSYDPEPHDTKNSAFSRWRGLQRPISLAVTHFGLLSYPKETKAEEKALLYAKLFSTGRHVVQLHSEVQLDFMQKVVTSILGCPRPS